jgi:glutamine amidotransferase
VCRHLAYVGEPVRLADLLLTPQHSLLRQSWAPRDMRGGGTVNADGYGIGWYPPADTPSPTGPAPSRLAGETAAATGDPAAFTKGVPGSGSQGASGHPHDLAGPDPHAVDARRDLANTVVAGPDPHELAGLDPRGVAGSDPRAGADLLPHAPELSVPHETIESGAGGQPVRLRRAGPMWTDASLPGLAATVVTGGALAAVRSATVGMPFVETACAPFAAGPWLFSHNGLVRGWPSSVAGLAARLPVTDLLLMDAPTDSALLWTLLRARLAAGEKPADAVASVVTEVAAAAPDSRLNLLLTNGSTIVGTAWTHALWVRALPGGAVVASEPYDDDPSWQEVPDRHLVTATPSSVDITGVGEQ